MPETRSRTAKRAKCSETLDSVVQRLRSIPQDGLKPVSQRLAAVLVPLFEDAEGVVRVVLTQRSHELPTHQGEVCLPGGKRDPTDPSDEFTALREAHEELGLDPSVPKVVCKLPPFLSKHYLSVTPVVAVVPGTPELYAPSPNTAEVSSVFDMPLECFLDSTRHSYRDLVWSGHPYRIHSFDYQGYNVWGLTAGILIQVAKLALGREPAFNEHGPRSTVYTRFYHDGQHLRVHTQAGRGVQADAGEQTDPGAPADAGPQADPAGAGVWVKSGEDGEGRAGKPDTNDGTGSGSGSGRGGSSSGGEGQAGAGPAAAAAEPAAGGSATAAAAPGGVSPSGSPVPLPGAISPTSAL